MNKLFQKDTLQADFQRDGYVVVPFLSSHQLEALRQLYQNLQPDHRFNTQDNSVSYHFSFLDPNRAYKKAVFDGVSAIVAPSLVQHFTPYSPLIINFVRKEPGLGEVPVHQNWNFVDESRYCSVSIWCPLVDVGPENGALEVIPGTHRLFRDLLRSPSIPWFFKRYKNVLLKEYLQVVPVKAGQALIFDDSLIHYSKPNRGDYDRTVIQVIAIPEGAQAKHYYRKQSFLRSTFYELDVDREFFLNFKFDITQEPEGVLRSSSIPYQLPKINERKFRKMVGHPIIA